MPNTAHGRRFFFFAWQNGRTSRGYTTLYLWRGQGAVEGAKERALRPTNIYTALRS